MSSATSPAERLLDPARRRTTVGLVAVVTLGAFEAMAVATVLPTAAGELGGIRLYGAAFTAFLVAELLGIVVAGQQVDRRGPARPFLAGLAMFAGGLVLAGMAPSMPVLVAGRAVQGCGAGAVGATVYVLIRIAYEDALRARIMAVTSSAWIVPALVGPAIAGAVAEHLHWRVIFLGVAPLVAPAVLLLAPVLRRVDTPAPVQDTEARTGSVRLLVSALRYRAGLPAAIAARAVLTMAFFGTEAFIPLGLTELRGLPAGRAGLALTTGAVGWTAGAWLQERLDARVSRPALVRGGMVVLALGILLVAPALTTGVPALLAAAAWAVAGVGMGVAYSGGALIVLAAAPAGRQGATMAALQLSDVLGALAGTGLGAAVVATSSGAEVAASTLVTLFVLLAAVAAGGALLGGRLPGGRAAARAMAAEPAADTVAA
jgi:MFS family permease